MTFVINIMFKAYSESITFLLLNIELHLTLCTLECKVVKSYSIKLVTIQEFLRELRTQEEEFS